jgi:hypothetical protein
MARLSVATWPPPDVMATLSKLERPPVPGVHWSTPEQWMVKVRPLGYVDDRTVPLLVDALKAELDGAPAVECVLDPATRRIGGQWLGAPVAGLDDLAAVVFEATEGLVPVTHPQPFQASSSPGAECLRSLSAGRVRIVDGTLPIPCCRPIVSRGSPVRERRRDPAGSLSRPDLCERSVLGRPGGGIVDTGLGGDADEFRRLHPS